MPQLQECLVWALMGAPIALALGITSHLLYFIRGERNKQAGSIAVWLLGLFTTLVLAVLVLCGSLCQAIILGLTLEAAFLVGLGGSISAYRLLWHPTRIYNGRKRDALTKWSAAYTAQRTQRYHAHLRTLHQKYGDIVRTGPQEISVNNVDAIQPIYGRDSLCIRGPWYDLGATGLNLHRTRDPDLHARQRPFWEKGFQAISASTEKVSEKTNHFMKDLAAKEGRINMAPELAIMTYVIMTYIVFSIDVGTDSDWYDKAEESYAILTRSQTALGTFGHVPWIYSVNSRFPGLIWQNDDFTKFATKLVERRRQMTPEKPDLFSYLLDAEGSPSSAHFPLEWEARLAMVAGSGNVSSALTSNMFYLSKDIVRLAKLRAEVDPLLQARSFDPHTSYTVLDATIFESIRLQPLVPNGGERKAPPEGLRVLDTYVPGDTVLRVPSHTIFRDERYFVRPNEWIPERWYTAKELVKDSAAFIPFSTGTYHCVGRPLGIVEIRLILARFVHEFDFALAQDADEFENSGQDHFGMVFEKLMLDVSSRKISL